MQAAEVYDLLRVHEKASCENVLRKAWNECLPACKDVVALALPLKELPCTLEAFRHKLSKHNNNADFLMASFYVVYVGRCDGQTYGWSKAPYDSKKKQRQEQKPLYTLETSSDGKEQTRFWSFHKVSNNMHKGQRVDSEDMSFVLKSGTCFTIFLREDNFDAQKSIFEGEWNTENGLVDAYAPVLLQLSGTNDEQTLKGNGIKLRRIVPAQRDILGEFCSFFFESTSELQALQAATAEIAPLRTITRPMKGCPLLCKVHENAFVYRDPSTGALEIVDSGLNQNLGSKLMLPEALLLSAMHSCDIDRALRMFSVAIGHKAVQCLVLQGDAGCTETSTVLFLHVDMQEALLLSMLGKCKAVECPSSLPKTSMLTMCFGKSIADNQDKLFAAAEANHVLQWYAPSTFVQVATADNREIRCNVVFEMELSMKQNAGQRDVQRKVQLMDEVSGFHHVIKVFHASNVMFSEETGLTCTDAKLLITWQFRPGLLPSTRSVSGTHRKRAFMSADTLDMMNTGEPVDSMLVEENTHKRKTVSFEGAT